MAAGGHSCHRATPCSAPWHPTPPAAPYSSLPRLQPHPSKRMRSPTGTPSGGSMGSTWSCVSLEAHSTCRGQEAQGAQGPGLVSSRPGAGSRGLRRRGSGTRRRGTAPATHSHGNTRPQRRCSRGAGAGAQAQQARRGAGAAGAHHAVRHDVPHLGGLEVAHHRHAPPPHALLRHKLDQAADHLARRFLPQVNLLKVERVGVGVAPHLRRRGAEQRERVSGCGGERRASSDLGWVLAGVGRGAARGAALRAGGRRPAYGCSR